MLCSYFEIKKKIVCKILHILSYRIKEVKENKRKHKLVQFIKKRKYLFLNLEIFTQRPLIRKGGRSHKNKVPTKYKVY